MTGQTLLAVAVTLSLEGWSRGELPSPTTAPQNPSAEARPAPSLDWLPGQWHADADSETPALELVWTKSAAGLHGELTELANSGARAAVATYDIAPAGGTWALSVREAPGVYRFSGERRYDEYIRFNWKSAPPESARRAAQAKRSKVGRGGLGPLVSSGSIAFVEFRHVHGKLMFRLVFGPARRAALERSYWFRPAGG